MRPESKSSEKPLLIGVTHSSLHDRYLGAMFGLAAGDALGTTLEFSRPGDFKPIDDMLGGGPFGLEPGQWTDDTSMALCLAESLIHCGGFDPRDQMLRYVSWWQHGHLSSTGECFDIGNATRNALQQFLNTDQPFSGSVEPHSAGNGSLMRLAPVPLVYRSNPASAVDFAAQSSRTTHAAAEAVDACRLMALLLVEALSGATKAQVLRETLWDEFAAGKAPPLAPKVLSIAHGSYKSKQPPAIRGRGYVVDSLEAALWAFYHSESFDQAVLSAANLGDDADTTAAICGQIAGAHYGLSGIRYDWLAKIAHRDVIAQLSRGLLILSDDLARRGS